MDYKKIIKDGIVTNNAVLIQLIGLCSVLAVSVNIKNAMAMSGAVIAVVTMSNMVVSLIRRWVPSKIRIPIYIVVIATFVTLVDMFLNAFLPDVYTSLGLFIPLIVVNCLILARAESFASKNKLIPSIVDGFANGLGFGVAIVILAFFRELLGSGTLLGYEVIPGFNPMALFVMPPGAFLILGLMIFALNSLRMRKKKE
ncbi:MAG: electron transport complex subunit E [Tissierellia bacterium]|nr:electron transport complex subunit E [Tissierellia bacterium]